MFQLEIIQNFRHNDKLYEKDKKVDIKEFDIDTIIKLNEKGYIKPLKHEELLQIEKDLKENKEILKSKKTNEIL